VEVEEVGREMSRVRGAKGAISIAFFRARDFSFPT